MLEIFASLGSSQQKVLLTTLLTDFFEQWKEVVEESRQCKELTVYASDYAGWLGCEMSITIDNDAAVTWVGKLRREVSVVTEMPVPFTE